MAHDTRGFDQESYARLFFTTIQHFTEQLLNCQTLGNRSLHSRDTRRPHRLDRIINV